MGAKKALSAMLLTVFFSMLVGFVSQSTTYASHNRTPNGYNTKPNVDETGLSNAFYKLPIFGGNVESGIGSFGDGIQKKSHSQQVSFCAVTAKQDTADVPVFLRFPKRFVNTKFKHPGRIAIGSSDQYGGAICIGTVRGNTQGFYINVHQHIGTGASGKPGTYSAGQRVLYWSTDQATGYVRCVQKGTGLVGLQKTGNSRFTRTRSFIAV